VGGLMRRMKHALTYAIPAKCASKKKKKRGENKRTSDFGAETMVKGNRFQRRGAGAFRFQVGVGEEFRG